MTAEQFHVEEVAPSYWRVTFTNGPLNLLDPDTVDQLAALVDRIEAAPGLTAVVFRSDNPNFFMAHWDFKADKARVAGMKSSSYSSATRERTSREHRRTCLGGFSGRNQTKEENAILGPPWHS
jgi:enoyl-CoA hydratase/carnithine racemase